MMMVPRLMVAGTTNMLVDMISKQQGKGEGKDNNNSAFPLTVERLEKSIRKTQQSATKFEAAGAISCCKIARMCQG